MSPDPKAQKLVEEGLSLYSEGRLDEALVKWDQALAIDPAVPRAAEYRDYVAENRSALAQSFEAASGNHPAVSVDATAAVDATADAATADDLSVDIDVGEEQEPAPALGEPALAVAPEVATQVAGNEAGKPEAGLDFLPAGGEDLALPPLRDLAMANEDLTPQIDLGSLADGMSPDASERTNRVDLGNYKSEIARSRVQARGGQPTPLSVVPGGGGPLPSGDDFEPAELTPVGVKLPQPSRLVGEGLVAEGELGLVPPAPDDPGELELLELDEEMMRGQATPAGLGEPAADEFAVGQATPSSLGLPAVGSLGSTKANAGAELGVTTPSAAGAGSVEMARLGSDDLLAGLGDMLADSELASGGVPAPVIAPKAAGFELGDVTAKGGQQTAAALGEMATGGPIPEAEGEQDVETMLAGARQLFEQGTHEGSLWLCERILGVEPDHGAAKALLKRNEDALLDDYEQKLGDFEVVPVVRVPQHEIVWHKLDHRAGFLLSRVDGMLTYGEILDISGMGRFETCRILSQLIDQGVIAPRK